MRNAPPGIQTMPGRSEEIPGEAAGFPAFVATCALSAVHGKAIGASAGTRDRHGCVTRPGTIQWPSFSSHIVPHDRVIDDAPHRGPGRSQRGALSVGERHVLDHGTTMRPTAGRRIAHHGLYNGLFLRGW